MFSTLRGVLLLTVMCTMAQAGFVNVRPTTVNGPAAGESSLQSVLDSVYGVGVIDANTDQIVDGVFGVSSQPGVVVPVLLAEFAGLANTNALDICDFSSGTVGACATIFDGSDSPATPGTPPTTATLSWATASSLFINGLGGFNVSSSAFVFALQTDGATYYSLDSLNPTGEARFVGYVGGAPAGAYTFGVEDKTDFDFNDFVFKVESIGGGVPTVPNSEVPEPSTVALGGLGLAFVLAAKLRKKRA